MASVWTGGLAAVGLVYIVLVAQFNTLWMPLLALMAVPLSINGVTLALLTTGHTLNLMSGQGLLMLSGIVSCSAMATSVASDPRSPARQVYRDTDHSGLSTPVTATRLPGGLDG